MSREPIWMDWGDDGKDYELFRALPARWHLVGVFREKLEDGRSVGRVVASLYSESALRESLAASLEVVRKAYGSRLVRVVLMSKAQIEAGTLRGVGPPQNTGGQ